MIFEPLSSQTVRNRTSSFLSLFQYFSFHLEVRELLSLLHSYEHSYELVHPCVTLAREDDLPYPCSWMHAYKGSSIKSVGLDGVAFFYWNILHMPLPPLAEVIEALVVRLGVVQKERPLLGSEQVVQKQKHSAGTQPAVPMVLDHFCMFSKHHS